MDRESVISTRANLKASTGRPVLDPQMAEALAINAALQPKGFDRDSLPIPEIRRIFEETRCFWNEGSDPVAEIEQCRVKTRLGDMDCRRYRDGNANAETLPLVIYLHGGGWVLGSLDSHDCVARTLCRETGAEVVSVDYALVPDHCHTRAIEQVLDLASALEPEIGERGLVLCGDSAGGHLAVLAAAMAPPAMRRHLRGVASFYGVLSADMTTASFREFGQGEYGLSAERMSFYWQQLRSRYSGPPGGEDPCRCDVASFPPAWLVAARCDVLRDATYQFADHLRAHGREVTVTTAEGMGHAYLGYVRSVQMARRTASEFGGFLRSIT